MQQIFTLKIIGKLSVLSVINSKPSDPLFSVFCNVDRVFFFNLSPLDHFFWCRFTVQHKSFDQIEAFKSAKNYHQNKVLQKTKEIKTVKTKSHQKEKVIEFL